ncbi:hypothetical protein [Mesorhizobium sp. Pch-S]|uniref:hypothetical protein n=1 Tax=Mesorhizobium sp. Pch-S TaxID=2082387 RepID=UPI001011E442|nr:hypothetical protein [Mesorhizobium sp. Pch-S]QAZ44192.1 hypothetical protein C1M53_15825 [Mesorhizobium sp. Pch-S]
MRILLTVLLIFVSSAALAESWTPPSDYDGGAVNNNSFDRAGDLGSLTQPDFNTPADKAEPGALGVVATNKFDTLDIYRFNVPANQWLVHFHLAERPLRSMWLFVHNARGEMIWRSRGGDEEDFILGMSPGDYFVSVWTDPGVANGRMLKYDLTIQARLVPQTDNAGARCSSAPLLDGYQNTVNLRGSLDNPSDSDAYVLFLPGDSHPFSVRVGRHYRMRMVDPYDNTRITLQEGPHDDLETKAYDPGYYCLYVDNSSVSGPANYAATVNPQIDPLGPRDVRGDPQSSIRNFNKGPLRKNGQYGKSRYIDRTQDNNAPDPALAPSHIYVVTEWLRPQQSHRLMFDLTGAQNQLELTVLRTNALVRTSIVDASDNLLAVASSNGTSLVNGFLPNQHLTVQLPQGRYYLVLTELGGTRTGTPYTISAMSAPR